MKKIEKNEILLFFGQWTSKVGDIIFDYINSIVIVSVFQSSSLILAIYQSSQTFINVLFNLIGGTIADIGERKKILIISDFLSALICLIASFFINSNHMAIALILANIGLALIFSFSSPTFRSIIPEMVHSDRIGFFNSISNVGFELIGMVCPVIGLALINFIGAREALLVNAVTFAISAVSEIFLVSNIKRNENKIEKKNIFIEILEGLKYLWNHKKIFILVIISALINFFLAGYNLLLPYTEVMYEKGFYGKILVASAIGGICGSFINSKIPSKFTNRGTIMGLFLMITGISTISFPIFSFNRNIFISLIPFVLFSIALTMFNINFMSFVQMNVNERYLGRVFSVIFTIAVAFMPVGSFFFSKFCDITNINSFYIIGIGILSLSVICILLFLKNNETKIN